MASRKQQKEDAKAARLAAEEAAASAQARTRRIQIIAGVVIAAVAVVAVIVGISISGGKSGGIQHGKNGTALYSQVNSLIGGIPETGTTLGSPSAKYTLTFYGDLQCPVCKAFSTGEDLDGTTGGLPQFIKDQVRTGNAKIEYRSFCTATCNDFSDGQSRFNDQQTAAYAAGKQDKFWYYAELFYRQQGSEGTDYMTPAFLNGIAKQIPGLSYATWTTDRGDPSLLSQVENDEENVQKYSKEVSNLGTPFLLMTGPKGSVIVGSGSAPYGDLQSALKAVA